jgi:hypothetical protein
MIAKYRYKFLDSYVLIFNFLVTKCSPIIFFSGNYGNIKIKDCKLKHSEVGNKSAKVLKLAL